MIIAPPQIVGMPGTRNVFAVMLNGRHVGAVVWVEREAAYYVVNDRNQRVGDVYENEQDAADAVVREVLS